MARELLVIRMSRHFAARPAANRIIKRIWPNQNSSFELIKKSSKSGVPAFIYILELRILHGFMAFDQLSLFCLYCGDALNSKLIYNVQMRPN